jgi:putative acyl-CoA dehydrogenase
MSFAVIPSLRLQPELALEWEPRVRSCAFGKRLIKQPLMKNVLADLCLESEAATALAMRLARGFDESATDEGQRRFTRIATAIGKYWITK